MRSLFIIHALLIPCFCFAQTQYSQEQLNRLADAGKVYGYIKYFHPGLQYSKLNWDSTFAANVEPILNARNKDEYALAMQNLLAPLNDNLTTVANIHHDKNYQLKPTCYEVKDSILIITMNDVTDASQGKIQDALQKTSAVKGIIFDMRRPYGTGNDFWASPGTALDLWSREIYQGDIMMPSNRNVIYDDLPVEKYNFLIGANFKMSTLYRAHGTASRKLPIVFIVTTGDEVPAFAMALAAKNEAAFVTAQGPRLVTGNVVAFYLQDSLQIKLRTSEGINADGSLAQVIPDETFSVENPGDAPVKAKELIQKWFSRPMSDVVAAPVLHYNFTDYKDKSNYPSLGYRVLAAAKIFAVIDNFFPDKLYMDRKWEESYRAVLPEFIGATDSLGFMRAVAQLYACIQDSHGFITIANDQFSLRLNPIIQGHGNYESPVMTRVIENKLVITGINNDTTCKKLGLKIGDIVLSVNGRDPLQMIDEVRKYQCASTKASQTFFVANFILFGHEGEIKHLKVQDATGSVKSVDMPMGSKFNGNFFYDPFVFKMYSRNTKPTFKKVSTNIGYADLTSPLKQKDIDSLFKIFKNTKAIIFDIRGYPHIWPANPSIYLTQKHHTLNAMFRYMLPSSPNIPDPQYADLANIHFSLQSGDIWGGKDTVGKTYHGKVIVLMDESAQSAAEHNCLIFKAIAGATLIGCPTSGANGGLVQFDIPGNLCLWYSGQEVLFPNGTRTQRIGIKPDITVYPSIKGIQAGKDEVLDRAIKFAETGK